MRKLFQTDRKTHQSAWQLNFLRLYRHLMLWFEYIHKKRANQKQNTLTHWFPAYPVSNTLPALAYEFMWRFYANLCVLSAWPVNTVRFMRWRRYIVSKPLRLLSSLPLELPLLSTQHVGQAPWVATLLRLTHQVVSMYECVCVRGTRSAVARGRSLERQQGSQRPPAVRPPALCVVTRYHR